MNVSTIINTARTNTHVTSAQVSDATAVQYLNMVYHDIANAIISEVCEDHFFQVWTRDAIASQEEGEYPYPEATSSVGGMLKLRKLALKYDANASDYTYAREVEIASLSHDWSWYLTNQSASDPIYFVADESMFIAPNFTSNQVQSNAQQIKLYGISSLIDLTTSGTEADIKIPYEHHWLLPLGIEQWIYRSRAKLEEARNSRTVYENARKDMLARLSNRDASTGTMSMPSTAHLE